MELQDSEIEAVKVLGEKIGYGNMMEIAHALWAESLSLDGVDRSSSAFYPILLSDMKKDVQSQYTPTRLQYRTRIKAYLATN